MIDFNEQNALAITKAAAKAEISLKFPMFDNETIFEILEAGIDIGWKCHEKFLEEAKKRLKA